MAEVGSRATGDADDGPLLSVVIPAYNEAATIGLVIERVAAAAPAVKKEIIVSNDGSRDGTRELLAALAEEGRIVLEDSAENRGKGAALRAGLARARGRIVLVQDADLEMDPADYPALLQPIVRGEAVVVYGSRFLRRGPRGSILQHLANRFLVALANLLYGTRLTDVETCYKVFRREALASIQLECDRFDFEPEVSGKLLRAGYDIHEVAVSYAPRGEAQGKKVRWHDGLRAAWVLVSCRFMPLSRVLAGGGPLDSAPFDFAQGRRGRRAPALPGAPAAS